MATAKARTAAQDSSVKGGSQKKVCGTFSLKTKARTIWVKPRNHTFFDEAVREWSNEEWKANFRVSRETFRVLCTKLKPSLKRRMVAREPL